MVTGLMNFWWWQCGQFARLLTASKSLCGIDVASENVVVSVWPPPASWQFVMLSRHRPVLTLFDWFVYSAVYMKVDWTVFYFCIAKATIIQYINFNLVWSICFLLVSKSTQAGNVAHFQHSMNIVHYYDVFMNVCLIINDYGITWLQSVGCW